jgi:hypothetical protein
MMNDSFTRRDADKEARLYAELGATLHAFIEREGASNGVIAHACGEFLGQTLAFLSASSLDDRETVETRLSMYTQTLRDSMRHYVQSYHANPQTLF